VYAAVFAASTIAAVVVAAVCVAIVGMLVFIFLYWLFLSHPDVVRFIFRKIRAKFVISKLV